MKKIKIILASFMLVAFFGCDQEDAPLNTVFDVVNGQSLVDFNTSSTNFSVLIDESGSTSVTIDVTTVSSEDRTVGISVDPSSTANPENYSIPSTVTIPADSFQGSFVIDGVDNSIEVEAETIVINIDSFSGNNVVLAGNQHTVNLFQVCPVPETYLIGDYTIVDSNANLSSNEVVTLSIPLDTNGDIIDPTVRVFNTTFLPGSSVETVTEIELNLVCGKFALSEADINVTCDLDGPLSFTLGTAGADNSAFSLLYDDDVVGNTFTVNYTEDFQGDCGTPSLQNFTLTKL